ncbi:MAG TPA: CBS domain-containing protein [Chitinophagales bacterium]|nr:CBS domain-containing protein [Chitinophagales bacterium]
MRASELIVHSVPTLSPSDKVFTALKLMQEFHITQLPVVSERRFLGLVSEEDLKAHGDTDAELTALKLNVLFPGVNESEHMFEVLKVAATMKLKAVPVIDKDNNYLGSISSESLLHYLAERTDILERGGIVVLDMAVSDYSLTEIARIVESNNAKILTVFAGTNPDLGRMELTLKVNTPNVQAIVQSLERFNYTIKDTYQEPEFYDNLRNRYDALMNYLNV